MIATTFPEPAVMAELMAKMLWEIEAVHFSADKPYKLSSGMASPVYIDCRKLISYPRIRSAIMDFAAAKVMRDAGFEKFDCVAGGETAGIPFAAFLAERLGLPMIYVRKAPKGHGRNAQIEGHMPEGAPCGLEQEPIPNPSAIAERGSQSPIEIEGGLLIQVLVYVHDLAISTPYKNQKLVLVL